MPLFLCNRFGWSFDDFMSQQINLSNGNFAAHCNCSMDDTLMQTASFLYSCLRFAVVPIHSLISAFSYATGTHYSDF
jgi:hypothetical protein